MKTEKEKMLAEEVFNFMIPPWSKSDGGLATWLSNSTPWGRMTLRRASG